MDPGAPHSYANDRFGANGFDGQLTAIGHNELNLFWKTSAVYVNLKNIIGLELKLEKQRSIERDICGKLQIRFHNSGSKLLKM